MEARWCRIRLRRGVLHPLPKLGTVEIVPAVVDDGLNRLKLGWGSQWRRPSRDRRVHEQRERERERERERDAEFLISVTPSVCDPSEAGQRSSWRRVQKMKHKEQPYNAAQRLALDPA
jgi:hypothetical protein